MKISNEQLARMGFRDAPRGSSEPSGEVERLRRLVQQLQQALEVEHDKRMKLAAIVRPLVERARAQAVQAQQVPQGRAYQNSDLGAPPRQGTPSNPEVLPPERGERPPRERKFAPVEGRPDPLRAIIEPDGDDADMGDDIEEMLDG